MQEPFATAKESSISKWKRPILGDSGNVRETVLNILGKVFSKGVKFRDQADQIAKEVLILGSCEAKTL